MKMASFFTMASFGKSTNVFRNFANMEQFRLGLINLQSKNRIKTESDHTLGRVGYKMFSRNFMKIKWIDEILPTAWGLIEWNRCNIFSIPLKIIDHCGGQGLVTNVRRCFMCDANSFDHCQEIGKTGNLKL